MLLHQIAKAVSRHKRLCYLFNPEICQGLEMVCSHYTTNRSVFKEVLYYVQLNTTELRWTACVSFANPNTIKHDREASK